MGRYADKLETYEMSGGIYNSRKLPKWHFRQVEILDYMQILEDDIWMTDQSLE